VRFSSTAFLSGERPCNSHPVSLPIPRIAQRLPLSDDQIRRVAPSIFADAPHESRSERYSYIPTAAVLTELRKKGFSPSW
jgi:hypothetical protein